MKSSIHPHLTLVGAGPGDEELITLKGIRALQKADAVLYDALVNPDLLGYARQDVPKVFVGKKFGEHYLQQEEINKLIVDHAFQYGHVVRLKGGDPFVFGRGTEELEYAESFGIGTSIVPGISSALAVPALQGIPMTHRGASEGFWVITGTTKSHALSEDVRLASRSKSTVVILMGMHKLAEIVSIFSEAGRGETPVAIIQDGSTIFEKVGIGTVDTILETATQKKLGSPAIIVIGDVVKLHRNEDADNNAHEWKVLVEKVKQTLI